MFWNHTWRSSAGLGDVDDTITEERENSTTQGGVPEIKWWDHVERAWPRRLLHLPTMISYERTGTSVYNSVKSPRYSTLSYTWGRFEADGGGRALPVRGVSWTIPAVLESAFSVEDFQRVLAVMGSQAEWAWVDVACIDQKAFEIKMAEVGRQVGIFKNAAESFVWLHKYCGPELQSLFDSIGQAVTKFSNISQKNAWTSDTCVLLLKMLLQDFQSLLSDPWFTSLWTLQESILRRDAQILAKDGDAVNAGGGKLRLGARPRSFSLTRLANFCQVLQADIGALLDIPNIPTATTELGRGVLHMLKTSGFNFAYTDNPNVQYSAARFRQTKYPLDRIFGIMQIYSLSTEEVTGSAKVLELEELQDNFAHALMRRSPLLGQLFVHSQPPRSGRTWRITEYSDVLSPFRIYDPQNAKSHCKVTKSCSETIKIEGSACSVRRLQALWEEYHEVYARTTVLGRHSVFLDAAYQRGLESSTSEEKRYKAPYSEHWFHNLESRSVSEFCQSVPKLVRSKEVSQAEVEKDIVAYEAWEVPPKTSNNEATYLVDDRVLLLGELAVNKRLDTQFFGMILRYDYVQAHWKRVGVCLWDRYLSKDHGQLLDTIDTHPIVWSSISVEVY